jgi:hypothetical protein
VYLAFVHSASGPALISLTVQVEVILCGAAGCGPAKMLEIQPHSFSKNPFAPIEEWLIANLASTL